jgi:hypothetical protein
MSNHDEFKKTVAAAEQAFSQAAKLFMDGKRAEGKKIEREGDAALKRAKAMLKDLKQGKAD